MALKFTELLRSCRGDRPLSLFAEIMHVTKAAINQWEVGRRVPPEHIIVRYAALLKMDVKELKEIMKRG